MLRSLQTVSLDQKTVLLRLDLDLPPKGKSFDLTRLEDGLGTLKYILEHGAKQVTIIGHRGRPEGKRVAKLSLKPIEVLLRKKLSKQENARVKVLENLRFDPGEEKNTVGFAKKLAKGFDVFVNDAFASYRPHASIVGLPKLLPSVLGLQFVKEVEHLEPIAKGPKRPYVMIFGGAKLSTKLPYLETFMAKADVLLVGGKLAQELKDHPIQNRKMVVGELTKDGKDISKLAAEQFLRFIAMAQTIVWNGPLGMYEDAKHRAGTKAIAQAIAHSRALSVIGGGDTEACLDKVGIEGKMKFISSGGGAMLEYLANGTLPALEAVAASPRQAL